MLTAETKRRLDACRDILVGKLPLPTDQIELITLALIYKFMDDLDEESVKLGGKRSFFVGPLEKYRWYILGGFAAVFVAGAVYIAKRSPGEGLPSPTAVQSSSAPKPASASSRSALLLEALKEELFQLEIDHKQGRLTQPEYDKAKAALDQTLERALKRTATP